VLGGGQQVGRRKKKCIALRGFVWRSMSLRRYQRMIKANGWSGEWESDRAAGRGGGTGIVSLKTVRPGRGHWRKTNDRERR